MALYTESNSQTQHYKAPRHGKSNKGSHNFTCHPHVHPLHNSIIDSTLHYVAAFW